MYLLEFVYEQIMYLLEFVYEQSFVLFVLIGMFYNFVLVTNYIVKKCTFDIKSDVDDTWFEQICLGKQTILGVVGDKDRFHGLQKWVGYNFCFYNKNCRIQKTLTNVVYYDSLENFITSSGFEKCAPHTESDKEAYQLYKSTWEIQHMHDHYEGKTFGIIGLEFY